MKYLKQILFSAALLLILISCFAFTVSATGYDYGAMEEPSAGDYPLIDPGVSEGPSAGDGDVVVPEATEPPPDVYVPVDPGPSDLYAFRIRLIGGFDHSYSFYKTDVSIWSDIWDAPSEYGAYFKINQGYLMYVFDGVQYYIFDHEDNHLIKPSDALASGYYDLALCSAGEHLFGSYKTMKEPTCTEGGYSLGVCGYCSSSDRKELAALGHDYNIVGTCTRCGHNFFFGGGSDQNNGSGSNQSGSSGSAGDSSGADSSEGGESGSDLWSDLGKWFGELGGKIKDGFGSGKDDFNKLGDSLLTIIVAILIIPLLVLVLPLLKVIGKGIAFIFESLIDLFKDLGESLSRKGKKK